jgi:hypothetical protein
MAKIPHAARAVAPEEKIVDYLLSLTHQDGRGKAIFFMNFGFHPDRWQDLAEALKRHARETDVLEEVVTPYGRKYILLGTMAAPDGRTPLVRSVWMAAPGQDPRLVTAYSGKD